MRNPIHVLKSLEEKASVRNYKYERLYRNLYNPEFYLLAYANIAKSQGSMTQGADGQTLDNMSLPRINRIIESIRNRTYQPKPAKRKYIPKKNGKMRPLGITSTDDKLVQEVVRMILEAIYEPTFSDYSHGFRPKRSCHTALLQVKRMFTGVTWIVEGDIHACFDNFDHHVLVELLRKRIKDEAFISLIWKFLKAGYMEQWEYNCTYSGVPQGSGISPICANIYLSELDGFMQEYKEKYDCEPERRKTTKEYERASRRYKKARKALENAEKSTPELVREFKDSRLEKMNQHYYNPFEEGYKKIQYNRYADDFVIGVIGSKRDAEKIKEDVRIFLKERLHLEMSEEKTEITHASMPVRYLGYDFKVMRSKSMKRCKNGDMKRVWNGKVFLYVPKEKWIKKAMERGAIQVKRNKGTGKETWRPMPRKDLMNRNDADIVSTFNSEIRGLYNFYRIAENVGVLHKYYYMVRYSMLKTLAGKHRTKVSAIKKRFMVDNADTIEGNCDTTLFLGGKEKTTLKELAEVLGKETIDLYNTSDTRGTSQSYGLNYQKTGKELMSQDEIAVMDGGKCIMQLRGVRPFFSDKFDITKHGRYRELSDYDQKNTFDIEDYVKHLQHMKVTPNTEVDEAFDCGEVSGQEDISPEKTE